MAAPFKVRVQQSGRRFTLPKYVREELGVKSGDSVQLRIRSLDGTNLFSGTKKLRSGAELYGTDIASALIPGSTVMVEASRSELEAGKNWKMLGEVPGEKTSRSAKNKIDDQVVRSRRFWIVSPNVTNHERSVSEWRIRCVRFGAAFMGYGPDDLEHRQIGHQFAHVIAPGDIVLIARRHGGTPEVVGFGVVRGSYKTKLPGFNAPPKESWHGSLRRLSPFQAWTRLPAALGAEEVLRHTRALRELIPQRTEAERRICAWLESRIDVTGTRLANRDPSKVTRTVRPKAIPPVGELEYEVRNTLQVRLARKREADLVSGYRTWLERQDRSITAYSFGRLQCDAYEKERHNLIEAKCSAKREYIRMAVGQLLDYANLGRAELGTTRLAILLPGRPELDIESWLLKELAINVIWRDEESYLDNANGQFT